MFTIKIQGWDDDSHPVWNPEESKKLPAKEWFIYEGKNISHRTYTFPLMILRSWLPI